MKKPDKHQTCREKADSDTERSTEKWFAVLLEENHLQYTPVSSVILVSVLGQRELLQLSHPDQSWFQGSMAADLLASDLPWEYWWKDKVISSEDSSKHPCQETRKRMDQKPAWVKAELKWSQQEVPPNHHGNLENRLWIKLAAPLSTYVSKTWNNRDAKEVSFWKSKDGHEVRNTYPQLSMFHEEYGACFTI